MSKSKRQIKKTIDKLKKKTWHKILAPALFNRYILGQSLVSEEDELLGKTIAANAMSVTGDMKKQHVTITFKVTSTKNGLGQTMLYGYDINPAYIKRQVKRNRNKLDLSFRAVTKNNEQIRIKPTLFTKNEASWGVCSALRRKAQESVVKYCKTVSFDEIVRDLLSGKMQNAIKSDGKATYPLRAAEIRSLAYEESIAPQQEAEAPETPAEGHEPKAEKPKRKPKAADKDAAKGPAKEIAEKAAEGPAAVEG